MTRSTVAAEWAAYELALQRVLMDSYYQGRTPTEREETLMRLAIQAYADPERVRENMAKLAELERPLRAVPPLPPVSIVCGRRSGYPPAAPPG